MPLEDTFADVIGKAERGLNLTDKELAARAKVSPEALHKVHGGHFDAAVLRKIAPLLHLNAVALTALPGYLPTPIGEQEIPGLAAFSTRYGEMPVNAYLVWDTVTKDAAAFDTGGDSVPIVEHLCDLDLTLRAIFLTHTHHDHRADVDRLQAETGATLYTNRREPFNGTGPVAHFDAGESFPCGRLRIETRLTWGHTRGGTSYVVHGLARPVVIVGDAMFAGSMGGAMLSYPDALRTNREQILSLPPETIICPGHGPLTSVGEELRNNPFFA